MREKSEVVVRPRFCPEPFQDSTHDHEMLMKKCVAFIKSLLGGLGPIVDRLS